MMKSDKTLDNIMSTWYNAFEKITGKIPLLNIIDQDILIIIKEGIKMASVRMQSRYWKMIHHGIELYRKELSEKLNHIREQIGNDNVIIYDSEYQETLTDCNRLDAIDALVQEAANKKDNVLCKGIGPDAPEPPPALTSEEEDLLRVIEQID